MASNTKQSGYISHSGKEIKSKKTPCPEEILQAEREYIKAWRKERGDTSGVSIDDSLTGLALSGGGIRSATFSLGVMQALAKRGVLKKMDYLSTVSGGGYIGSALTWFLSRKANASDSQISSDFGLDADNFPYGTDDPNMKSAGEYQDKEQQQGLLNYLRDHGYYLTPGSGINAFSLLGVILRGALLNLSVWLPMLFLFFTLGLWIFGSHFPGPMHVIPFLMPDQVDIVDSRLFGFELFLWLFMLLTVALVLLTFVYSIATRFIGAWRHSYGSRRWAERWAAVFLMSAPLVLLVGALPVIGAHFGQISVGPMAILSGLAVILRNFLKSSDDSEASNSNILAPLAAALLIFGGALVAYEFAYWISNSHTEWLPMIVTVLIASSLLLGWLVNLNYVSIHRYYRDRLMESFMPDVGDALGNKTGAADAANTASLTDFSHHKSSPKSPYHIVNTNVVLVDSNQPEFKNRGGDSFMLSPLYCGSDATGWCKTESFAGGTMTLATAIAISGAAANANTGVGGEGLTRNRLVSFVMSLLNLGLGYWAKHPNSEADREHLPNHFYPGTYSFGNLIDLGGFNEERAFLKLSDGGHFENTGVYELIRRRARLIIACDGGADPDFSFSDFQTTIRRIEDDFSVHINILDDASPNQLVPQESKCSSYPQDVKFSEQGHIIGHIRYADNSDGWIIFLKTTLVDDVSFKVKGYAAQNKAFPDQSTADQFFDEVQFEAYRELGYRLAIKMLDSNAPNTENNETLRDNQGLEEFIKACST